MRKHRPKNERIKRKYLIYLREAKRMSEKSVDQAAAAIAAFEASTGYRDFAAFHIEQARAFKRRLSDHRDPVSGKPLAKSTIHSRLMAVKAFVHWLAGQPGYKSGISYSDADYFNPSANDSRIATARRERPAPSVEQVRHVINTMPAGTDIERRDRALIAFALLTGARDNALSSFSLKHVDLERRTVFQDARSVRTKNRKSFTTWFFPVGEDIEMIVADWIVHLRDALLFGPDDPLFPATRIETNADGLFAPAGVSRKHWKNADAVRRIFRQAFEAAGLPYHNPHSLRTTLTLLGETECPSIEAMKAWSQNLGHEKMLTTLTSYGTVPAHRHAEIFEQLRRADCGTESDNSDPSANEVTRVLEYLHKANVHS